MSKKFKVGIDLKCNIKNDCELFLKAGLKNVVDHGDVIYVLVDIDA